MAECCGDRCGETDDEGALVPPPAAGAATEGPHASSGRGCVGAAARTEKGLESLRMEDRSEGACMGVLETDA